MENKGELENPEVGLEDQVLVKTWQEKGSQSQLSEKRDRAISGGPSNLNCCKSEGSTCLGPQF